jgi:ribulose bisphosphate carboxylase small subunit
MHLPSGHTECYFSEDSRHNYPEADAKIMMQHVEELLSKGWKVGFIFNPTTKFFTLYWGA